MRYALMAGSAATALMVSISFTPAKALSLNPQAVRPAITALGEVQSAWWRWHYRWHWHYYHWRRW